MPENKDLAQQAINNIDKAAGESVIRSSKRKQLELDLHNKIKPALDAYLSHLGSSLIKHGYSLRVTSDEANQANSFKNTFKYFLADSYGKSLHPEKYIEIKTYNEYKIAFEPCGVDLEPALVNMETGTAMNECNLYMVKFVETAMIEIFAAI